MNFMAGTVILNVVIVLGIIVAGGFLIFFMGDLLMSIVNPKKDEKKIKAKEEKAIKKMQEKINGLSPETASELKKDPEVANLLYNGVIVESYNPEAEEAQENASVAEETTESSVTELASAMEETEVADAVTETETESTEEVASAEESEEEMDEAAREEAERTAYIEQRRRELMERLARMSADEDDEDEEDDVVTEEDEEVETVDVTESEVETFEDEDISEESVETEETADETNEDLVNARKALEEERAKNEALLAELNFAKAQMMQDQNVAVAGESNLSAEDYAAKLAVDQERLKLNEKELRACKKEYFPLRRVKKTLENDEKKLRRKEALVAKQKVMLYGVNNYADIDEEKAKKLAEDLDLLDGLKLSVEHCEEVMTKNKDRYPLLEKMYDILSAQNAEIKADIEKAEAEIAKLNDTSDTEPNE